MPINFISTLHPGSEASQMPDCALRTLLLRYDLYGGVVTGEEVVARMRDHASQPLSIIARRILGRSMVNFKWRSEFLVPLFQFDGTDMSVCPCTQAVVAELASSFDDWDLASWFVTPNSWIGGMAPARIVRIQPVEVLEAARADRVVARRMKRQMAIGQKA